MFNQHTNEKLKEDSSFNPISPYAEGKFMVHKKIETIKKRVWLVNKFWDYV